MDGDMSYAAIEVLVQNLIIIFNEDRRLIRGLDEDARQLQTTLGITQSYLNDAEKKSISQDAVELWLRQLEAVAFDADNTVDELRYHLLHKKVKTAKEKVLSSLNHFPRRRYMALTIKEINTMFDNMNKRATDLGLQIAPAAAAASFETTPFTINPIFIGRDDDVQKLVEKLTDNPEDRIFSILAIVGIGGLGKTTLTRKVFNHENVKARFGSHIWIHVSRIFDPIMLFKKILSTLTSQTTDEVESEESILQKLLQALIAKTYLLVLDDVWNEDLPKWKYFINSISGVTSTKGNAIIITTRTMDVASIVTPLHIHFLKELSNEDCLSVIKAKSFRNGELPLGYDEGIGEKIAKTCWGLPLTANVVGGLLWRRDWPSIEQKWFPDVEGYFISDFLRLSFDSPCPPSLKKCFAYCSIFPKGCRIRKQELIELWMAEGFLQPDQINVDMESMGNNFFNFLLHNSLLLVVESDNLGNVESCVMHDCVHEYASDVLGSSNGTNEVRYLIHEDASPIPQETAKYVRTLILRGEITNIDMFSGFTSMHALTLDCDKVKELPNSIMKLIHLRKLDISRTRIEYLPEWISDLHYLQTLNASMKWLRELPSTFKYMVSLRQIYIPSRVKLPPQIGTFTNLQTLRFRVGKQKGYKIEELGSLKNLKQLYIYNLENVLDQKEAGKARLLEKASLMELLLEWDADREGETNDKLVLEGLKPQTNLSKLEIKGIKGRGFPSWFPQLEGLRSITLSRCQGYQDITTLGELPNLKSLNLWRLSNVTLMSSSFHKTANSGGRDIFPALESIFLSDMHVLRVWVEGESADAAENRRSEVKAFRRLQLLKIYHCYKLEYIPTWFTRVATNLKELDIRHCSKLSKLAIGVGALDSVESITIKGCQDLKSIVNPSHRESLKSLRSLEIRECHDLKEIMLELCAPLLEKVCMAELKSLENLPSFLKCLEKSPLLELTIVGVPNFISSSTAADWPFYRLRKLEMDASRVWPSERGVDIKEKVDGILQKCCFSLGELILTGTEIWTELPGSIQDLTALYSLELESFVVEELPKWFGNLSSLTRLRLSNCSKLKRLPSLDAMKRLTKLHELHIRDCPELRIDSERHKISHSSFIYLNGHLV